MSFKQHNSQFLSTSGSAHSAHANRLSYAFNLRGPSFAVDTACASSMTALHLACVSLRAGECQVAVVAGSNTLIVPETTVGFSQLGVLSPEGKDSKTLIVPDTTVGLNQLGVLSPEGNDSNIFS